MLFCLLREKFKIILGKTNISHQNLLLRRKREEIFFDRMIFLFGQISEWLGVVSVSSGRWWILQPSLNTEDWTVFMIGLAFIIS